jgi:hypothetical protein
MLKLLGQAAKNYAIIKLLDRNSDALLFRYIPDFQKAISPNARKLMSELIKRHYLYVTDTALNIEEAAACKLIALYQMNAEVGREQIDVVIDAFQRDFSEKLSSMYWLALSAREIDMPSSPLG